MTANFSKRRERRPRQSEPASAEVTIQIAERDGQHVLVVRETSPVDSQIIQQIVALSGSLSDEWSPSPAGGAVAQAEASAKPVRFANESEAEFARILSFYHIEWQYEPRSFAIEWDAAGAATSFFKPDFYLPQHNLYIELTTLRQPLVTRKNRKIRRLRALYPEVHLKVLYAADYRKLIEKYAGSNAWQESDGDK
ncbi:MAG TPA: hypothetical protein VKA60_10690 [Blastocatellia bacterium]|nr:hypothetical protein [Blastocatellia bacterium]